MGTHSHIHPAKHSLPLLMLDIVYLNTAYARAWWRVSVREFFSPPVDPRGDVIPLYGIIARKMGPLYPDSRMSGNRLRNQSLGGGIERPARLATRCDD